MMTVQGTQVHAWLKIKKPMPGLAQQLVSVNEDRKRIVNEAYDIVMKNIELPPLGPVIVHMPQLHEGIVGIVAGKLSESLKVPAYDLPERTN